MLFCREFEQLRHGVVSLWEQLGVPAESVFSFLSECDLLASFHPRVLELYTRAYTDLTGRTPPVVASSRVHGVCARPLLFVWPRVVLVH